MSVQGHLANTLIERLGQIMKQFTFAIFLFSLITSSSQAQRGWRLFSGMGGTGMVRVIHESRDATLWVGGEDGLWHYDGSSWLESLA